jgi:hypothetical protein
MDNKKLSHQDLYEEIGRTYRYYLNWRHASFAGYLIIMYALFLEHKDDPNSFDLYAISIIITIVFWMIEKRIRDLYQACTKAGKELELNGKTTEKRPALGIYTKLENLRDSAISHSRALDLLFASVIIGIILILLVQINII